MKKVGIVGFGTTQFKARWIEKTYYELAYDAAKLALEDAGIGKKEVGGVVYGIYNEFFERQFMPDVYIHNYIGMGLKPSVRVATGGATGGAAVFVGWTWIASGLYDIVMVLGVEKATDNYNYQVGHATPETLKAILFSGDMTFENPMGLTAAASYALPLIAHIDRYGTPTERQMAMVSVKNHKNAFNNPIAQSPKILTVDEVLHSKMITYPFKFYDNCLYSEGASAIILASEERAKSLSDNPAWITGVGLSLDKAFAGERDDITVFTSSLYAGNDAYKMAGIKHPTQELDFAELHDAFTGAEILSYEAFNFSKPGQGGRLIEDGVVEMTGSLPVNPSGGLIGCGHAVGATGVMQTGEAALQVRERAGKRQVRNARKGLVQSIGGPATAWTAAVIVERIDKVKARSGTKGKSGNRRKRKKK
jgi:acetyl-CoA C-acetyltransferase